MPTLESRHFHAEHHANALVVRDKRRVAPAIIGLPFLVAGLWMWALVVMVVWSHVRAGSIGTPGGYLPIVGILLAGGAPFLWVAVRLTLRNRSVRIARAEGRVEAIADYVLLRRVTERRLAEFAAVVLRKDLRHSRSRDTGTGTITAGPHVSLVVELRPSSPEASAVLVAFDYEQERIRPLGALVAQHTGLPFVDELQSPTETSD